MFEIEEKETHKGYNEADTINETSTQDFTIKTSVRAKTPARKR